MAKKFYYLYPELVSFDNLLAAYRKAAKGKRGQVEIADFEFHLERNLFTLQEELAAQTYQPAGYRSFYVRDPKRRRYNSRSGTGENHPRSARRLVEQQSQERALCVP
jgi:hypothetical protein